MHVNGAADMNKGELEYDGNNTTFMCASYSSCRNSGSSDCSSSSIMVEVGVDIRRRSSDSKRYRCSNDESGCSNNLRVKAPNFLCTGCACDTSDLIYDNAANHGALVTARPHVRARLTHPTHARKRAFKY